MTGVIDVGGGLRGVYGAGVFDACLEDGISFDYMIGVSAGSANISSYMAGQKERNLKFYTDYCFRRSYMSLLNVLRTGSYIDLEYIYGVLSNSAGENPLDFNAIAESDKKAEVVVTNAYTAEPFYYNMKDMKKNDYGAVKASSCIPVINKPYVWKGTPYFDGGLSDPIPFKRAFDSGCDKVVVILTRPKDFRRKNKNDIRMARFIKKYDKIAEALRNRAELYNNQLDEATEFEKEGRIKIIAPDSIEGMHTLTKDKDAILKMYEKGKNDEKEILKFI